MSSKIELRPRVAPSMKMAAQYIGHGLTRTYQLVAEGKIRTVKIGRKRLPLMESLDALIDAHIQDAA